MEKQRQIKILSIVALVLAITGMTLGFAAFSATLNISSSASVSPSSDAFKVRFVGINGDDQVITSNAKGLASEAQPAVIGSDGLTITGINVPLSEIGDGVQYNVYIENQGEYDAVITNYGLRNIAGYDRPIRCIGDEVSPSLLTNFCNNMGYSVALFSLDNTRLSSIAGTVIKKGEKIRLATAVFYAEDSGYIDGPVNVQFGDAFLEFGVYAE